MCVPTATGERCSPPAQVALILLRMLRATYCHSPRLQYLRTDGSFEIRMKMFNDSRGFTALEKSVY